MDRSFYSDLSSYLNKKVKIKRGLFGRKLFNVEDQQIKMPRKSKVEFRFSNNGVKLYANKSEIASETFDKIWFDSNNPNIMYATVDGKGTMKIDCLTGKHTPFCSDIRYNLVDGKYCVDTQGNILQLHEDCTTTETGLVRVEEKSDSAHMVCKNKDGKYVILDITTLKPIVDKEFDNEDVSCTLINQSIDHIPTLRVVSNNNEHYLVDKNNKTIKTVHADSVTKMLTGSHPVETILFYDTKKNKSTIINYDSVTNKIKETYEVDNLVCDIRIEKGQTYLITSDKQDKMGVVNKKNETIIPNKYDSINVQFVQSYKSRYSFRDDVAQMLFHVENNDKHGALSIEGKELLPCEYKKIDFDLSIKNKNNYRFLAKNTEDMYGVINSDGKIEADFIYKVGDYVKTFHQVGSKKYNNSVKATSDKKYDSGLMLKNTKTGKNDYYMQHEENCLIDSGDADIYYSGHESRRTKTTTVQVPKYSEEDKFVQGIINGAVIDNIPLGMMLTDAIMSEETETKTVEVEDDEMNY